MKQIHPASITGKASGFAAGGSVLDHAFGESDAYTLGVEEECMLLDSETFDLVQRIDTVLAAVQGHELEPRINAELMQSVLEIATPVCHTAADVEAQLVQLRTYVSGVAREQGLRVYCQALVKYYSERFDAGDEVPSFHRILTTENKWLAARYGLEAPVMDLVTGRRNRMSVAQVVRRTLKLIAPHAKELGSEVELAGIEQILRRGNGADRQLRVFNANRDIVEVTREVAQLTEIAPAVAPTAATA